MNVLSSSCQVGVSFSNFHENLIFSKYFQKILNYEVSKNPPAVRRADGRTDAGRTDGHDEANSRFPEVCERA